MGHLFVLAATNELNGILSRTCNDEQFIIFMAAVLQRSPEVKKAQDIRKRIETRLEQWSRGKYNMLVEDTVRASMSLINSKRCSMTDEHIAKTYTRLVI